VKIHKTNHVNYRIGKKWGACVLSTMSSVHSIFSILIKFKQQGFLKIVKKSKKWTTLDLNLHFGFPNYEFSFKVFFLSRTIGFPSKMMPCRLNYNLICLGLGSFSKSFGTNLKLLTNRNVRFHWTSFLGALSKVALNVTCATQHVLAKLYNIYIYIYMNHKLWPNL
jgi:hypothetical protein